MALVVVRHGRTAVNAGGRLLGRADPELDEEGRRQAAALADALGGAGSGPGEPRVRQVVSSPLGRCRATAEVVASRLGQPVELDERWVELDYGELDGASLGSIPPETWAAWRSDTGWAPPGGESLVHLGERVRAACEDLASVTGDGDGDVLVVTHVSPIKAAVAWALGVGDEVAWRMFVAPASITRIAVQGGRRSLHTFNETSHLPN